MISFLREVFEPCDVSFFVHDVIPVEPSCKFELCDVPLFLLSLFLLIIVSLINVNLSLF
jgi:hypothetical protein